MDGLKSERFGQSPLASVHGDGGGTVHVNATATATTAAPHPQLKCRKPKTVNEQQTTRNQTMPALEEKGVREIEISIISKGKRRLWEKDKLPFATSTLQSVLEGSPRSH